MPKRVRDTAGTRSDREQTAASIPEPSVPSVDDDDWSDALDLAVQLSEPELDEAPPEDGFEEQVTAANATAAQITGKSKDALLEAVKKAARARSRSEERTLAALQGAVREARAAGLSLREIESVAGVSRDTVDRWTK